MFCFVPLKNCAQLERPNKSVKQNAALLILQNFLGRIIIEKQKALMEKNALVVSFERPPFEVTQKSRTAKTGPNWMKSFIYSVAVNLSGK